MSLRGNPLIPQGTHSDFDQRLEGVGTEAPTVHDSLYIRISARKMKVVIFPRNQLLLTSLVSLPRRRCPWVLSLLLSLSSVVFFKVFFA